MIRVLTVTYNNRAGLSKTHSSLVSQDSEDYQWIVVDGGSDDGTVRFLEELSARDSRIKFVSERDEGIYHAMNKALDMAEAAGYVVFMNAGDVFASNNVLSLADKYDPEENPLLAGSSIRYGLSNDYRRGVNIKRIRRGMPFEHQAAFFSARISKKLKYSKLYRYSGDYDFVARFVLNIAGECKRLDFEVCKFEVGGVSHTNRFEAILEDSLIRYRVMGCSVKSVISIALIHIVWHKAKGILRWSR